MAVVQTTSSDISNELSKDSESDTIYYSTKYPDNAAKYLKINERGKIKWTGPFTSLKLLMNELTEKECKWSTPGSSFKLLELDELSVRWYSDNNSLTINGFRVMKLNLSFGSLLI